MAIVCVGEVLILAISNFIGIYERSYTLPLPVLVLEKQKRFVFFFLVTKGIEEIWVWRN